MDHWLDSLPFYEIPLELLENQNPSIADDVHLLTLTPSRTVTPDGSQASVFRLMRGGDHLSIETLLAIPRVEPVKALD